MYLIPDTLVWFLKVYTMPEQLTIGANTISGTQMGTFIVRKFLFMHRPVSLYPSDSRSGPAVTFPRQNVTTSRIHCTVDSYMHYGLLHLTWQTVPILGLYLKSTWYITKPTSRRSDILPCWGGEKRLFLYILLESKSLVSVTKRSASALWPLEKGCCYIKCVHAHTQTQREI